MPAAIRASTSFQRKHLTPSAALAVGDWTYPPSSYFPNNDNRLNRARVSWFCGTKLRAIGWPQGGGSSREEFLGAAGYEAPLGLVKRMPMEIRRSGTSRVSPGVDSLNCGRKVVTGNEKAAVLWRFESCEREKGENGKRTQGESVEIWVGKASSSVQGQSSPLPQASGPGQTTLDETAHTRQMFSVPELQTPWTSFCNDETCSPKRCNSAMRIAIASQGTLRNFHVARTQAYHSPTRVVPDANGGKEEEEGSVLGAVPRHAPDSIGRSAQSAAGAGL
ncbi:hypothetical protein EDB83DRAFT_2319785 [Lactarius deliciosus]|nr:hypothetical protein EDB83DRAFT_2319785 [Lactarius deliciosus]